MVTEVWKKIPNFEGYEVSSKGRLRRAERKRIKDGVVVKIPPRMLHSVRQSSGYYHVALRKDGKTYQDRLHRLVALAFIPNDDVRNKTFVNHKNEDKSDSRVENLEWMSTGDNTRFGTSIQRSSKNHWKPVTDYDNRGKVVARFNSIQDANKAVGAGPSSGNIGVACRNGGKSHGFFWKFTKRTHAQ